MSKAVAGSRRLPRISFESNSLVQAEPAREAGGPPTSDSPRALTGGESQAHNAFVDWLSFTVGEECFANAQDWAPHLAQYLMVPELRVGPRERGVAGFLHSSQLQVETERQPVTVGKLAWGGDSQRGRVYVALAGTLCARVHDWIRLQLVLQLCDARITRLDLAHDDVHGTHSVDRAVDWYEDGGFNTGGRDPNCQTAGDWLGTSGKGRTFYVGNRRHGKLLRVYEKGKQLGDALSPWVRWEVEFHNRDRWLPYDMLTDPAPYLAGAFPALAFVSSTPRPIRTQRKAVKASLEHLIEHLAKSYGKTINALRLHGFDADDILAQLIRPGLPNRLKQPMAACPPGTKLYGESDGDS